MAKRTILQFHYKSSNPIDFRCDINYNKGVTESKVMILSPRTGRPKVDNPKQSRFSIRLDDERNTKLQQYCQAHNITKGEAIRQGIDLLLSKQK